MHKNVSFSIWFRREMFYSLHDPAGLLKQLFSTRGNSREKTTHVFLKIKTVFALIGLHKTKAYDSRNGKITNKSIYDRKYNMFYKSLLFLVDLGPNVAV